MCFCGYCFGGVGGGDVSGVGGAAGWVGGWCDGGGGPGAGVGGDVMVGVGMPGWNLLSAVSRAFYFLATCNLISPTHVTAISPALIRGTRCAGV